MQSTKFISLLVALQVFLPLEAMNHVVGPGYIYGEWQTASIQYKSYAREIHKELFCPLRDRLIRSAYVKTIYACDAPDSIENFAVLVLTNHAIKLDSEPPHNLKTVQMSHGVAKNMLKFLSAYVQLSKIYRWGYIECGQNSDITLTQQAANIASEAAKNSLRRLCKRAKLKFSDGAQSQHAQT